MEPYGTIRYCKKPKEPYGTIRNPLKWSHWTKARTFKKPTSRATLAWLCRQLKMNLLYGKSASWCKRRLKFCNALDFVEADNLVYCRFENLPDNLNSAVKLCQVLCLIWDWSCKISPLSIRLLNNSLSWTLGRRALNASELIAMKVLNQIWQEVIFL